MKMTFLVAVGNWAGISFHLSRKGGRLVLGWIAFTLFLGLDGDMLLVAYAHYGELAEKEMVRHLEDKEAFDDDDALVRFVDHKLSTGQDGESPLDWAEQFDVEPEVIFHHIIELTRKKLEGI